MGSIPGLGRSPGGGDGNSLQDWGVWWATVYGVTKSRTGLSTSHTQKVKVNKVPPVSPQWDNQWEQFVDYTPKILLILYIHMNTLISAIYFYWHFKYISSEGLYYVSISFTNNCIVSTKWDVPSLKRNTPFWENIQTVSRMGYCNQKRKKQTYINTFNVLVLLFLWKRILAINPNL